MLIYPKPFYGSEVDYKTVMSLLRETGYNPCEATGGIHIKTPVENGEIEALQKLLSDKRIPFDMDKYEDAMLAGNLVDANFIAERNRLIRNKSHRILIPELP